METATEQGVGVKDPTRVATTESFVSAGREPTSRPRRPQPRRPAARTNGSSLEWAPVGVWAADAAALFPPSPPQDPTRYVTMRRALNLAVALVGIVLTAPVMLLVALLVKLSSRGPVLYKQPRVGIDRRHPLTGGGNRRRDRDSGGRIFEIYKFRTMYTDSDKGKQVWATPDDPRVTPVGRVLRRTRLDELPQLFNVLRGDMNVVGPRPEQPLIFQRLCEEVPGYDLRQRVRPGITGLAQITHPYDQDLDDVRRKLRMDLEYIRRSSTTEDLSIMVKTLPVLVSRSYGW